MKLILMALISLFFLVSCSSTQEENIITTNSLEEEFTPPPIKKLGGDSKTPIPEDKKNFNRCIANDSGSCLLVAKDFEASNNTYSALYYYEAACNLKNSLGCYHAGFIKGKKEEHLHAKYFFQKGCSLGHGDSCFEMALYLKDLGHEKNYILLEKACRLESYAACKYIADYQLRDRENISKALEYYKLSCKNGVSESCYNLGIIYSDTMIDREEALKYFEESCKLRSPLGCFNLACLYSLQKNIIASLTALQDSVKHGLSDIKLIEDEPDLKNIRKENEYIELVKRLEQSTN